MGFDSHNRQAPQPKPTAADVEGEDTKPRTNNKEGQAIRDAHFFENGVKADGTGGVPPESEQ